jgi:tryptophanyl-tRNA synthetase
VAAEWEEKLRVGGTGYGDVKKALFGHYSDYFAPARQRRAELSSNLDHVHALLRTGAEHARAAARPILTRAREAAGLA